MARSTMAPQSGFRIKYCLLRGGQLCIKRLGRLGASDHLRTTRIGTGQHRVDTLWGGHAGHFGAHGLPVSRRRHLSLSCRREGVPRCCLLRREIQLLLQRGRIARFLLELLRPSLQRCDALDLRHYAWLQVGRALLPFDGGELAGATDWLWMSLMRAGRTEEARAHLASRPDTIPTTVAYAQRLKLYRGEIGPDALFTPADTSDVNVATLGYALGNWHLLRGDTTRARAAFERAIAGGGWPAFGFIAAEQELKRLARAKRQ